MPLPFAFALIALAFAGGVAWADYMRGLIAWVITSLVDVAFGLLVAAGAGWAVWFFLLRGK